jgi:hypothetical protein
MAHKLIIELKGSNPKIFRKVIVPENFTFDQLHIVIQITMTWQNSHLHQFFLGQTFNSTSLAPGYLEDDDFDDDDFGFGQKHAKHDSATTSLAEFVNNGTKKFNYVYDFGDNWEHEIRVLAKPKTETLYPSCIDGAGPIIIEDCGGIWGFYNMLEVLNGKNSQEKKDYLDWTGLKKTEKYEDIFQFDILEVNQLLIEVFRDMENSDFNSDNF